MPPAPPWPVYSELAVIVDHLWGHAEAGFQHHVQPGEETLTDLAMLSQKRRRFSFTQFRGRLPVASSIKVHKFNNKQESKTGADWNLLLFDASGQRVSFRMQAKNLYQSGRFSAMKKAQTDRLIRLSARQGAIPLFALYQGPQHEPDPSKGEARSACHIPGANDRMGCVVRDAVTLDAAGPTSRNQWQAEATLGLPLYCLVACFCHGSATGSGPSNPPGPPDLTSPPRAFEGPVAASNVVGKAAMAAARERQRDAAALARLAEGLDASPPQDQLGEYWDEHGGDLRDLDPRGTELFEDVSHIMVIDERD